MNNLPDDFNKYERVEDTDPRRCQANDRRGQCHLARLPESEYCVLHGGNRATEQAEKKRIRQYRLAKWQERVNDFAESSELKSLREEIGILRMTLEHVLNTRCKTVDDLLIYSPQVGDMVMKINTVVTSCHKLEANMGQHLDKQQIINFASELVGVVANVLDGDELKISIVVDKIEEVLNRLGE